MTSKKFDKMQWLKDLSKRKPKGLENNDHSNRLNNRNKKNSEAVVKYTPVSEEEAEKLEQGARPEHGKVEDAIRPTPRPSP